MDWKNVINKRVKVSVVIPVYNAEDTISSCIDSILAQTYKSFEIIIVNDGSTDSTADVINEYNGNKKILYYEKKHDGISETLNLGIAKSNGTYIVRMDADDIMLPNRLKHQLKYMESHPEIDILSSSAINGNINTGTDLQTSSTLDERTITISDLLISKWLIHTAVIMKRSSILSLPYLYEQYWEGIEDHKLWFNSLLHGLVIATEPTDVIVHYTHNEHDILINNDDIERPVYDVLLLRLKRLINFYLQTDIHYNNLTVIIPFRNEGSEIERTIQNVRATADGVNVILINDASDDNYDYRSIAKNFRCIYVENKEPIGVAAGRDLGVNISKTNYFMLLDGHMRFYDDDWDLTVIKYLSENPKTLLTSMSATIARENSVGAYSNEYGDAKVTYTFGAYINMHDPGYEFTGKWTHIRYPRNSSRDELITISCVMGACYCSSKEWWNYIGGLQGLHNWGQDEPLMSLKTWLLGGKVLCMQKLYVGHVYRNKSPWKMDANKIHSNSIYINHLFARNEDELLLYDNNLKERIGKECFSKSMKIFKKHIDEYNLFKQYFDKHQIKTLDWFITNINEPLNANKKK